VRLFAALQLFELLTWHAPLEIIVGYVYSGRGTVRRGGCARVPYNSHSACISTSLLDNTDPNYFGTVGIVLLLSESW